MKKVEIFVVDYCPYCKKALEFLDEKGVKYSKFDITADEEEMMKKLGETYKIEGEVTVPQIIIDGKRIGGYDDMMSLYEKGELSFE